MKQSVWYEVQFENEHTPNSEPHLRYIAERYLESKGVIIRDGKIII